MSIQEISLDVRLANALARHPFQKFLISIASQLKSGRTLSQAQFDAVIKVLDQLDESDAALANVEPLLPGLQIFTGIVSSLKEVDGKYGVRFKMVIKLDNGNRVYSTVPSKLVGSLQRGQSVKIQGTLTVSNDDPHFGFVNSPKAL